MRLGQFVCGSTRREPGTSGLWQITNLDRDQMKRRALSIRKWKRAAGLRNRPPALMRPIGLSFGAVLSFPRLRPVGAIFGPARGPPAIRPRTSAESAARRPRGARSGPHRPFRRQLTPGAATDRGRSGQAPEGFGCRRRPGLSRSGVGARLRRS